MRSERVDWCWNAVGIFSKHSECSWNALPMPLDISPPQMHHKSFECEQNLNIFWQNWKATNTIPHLTLQKATGKYL